MEHQKGDRGKNILQVWSGIGSERGGGIFIPEDNLDLFKDNRDIFVCQYMFMIIRIFSSDNIVFL